MANNWQKVTPQMEKEDSLAPYLIKKYGNGRYYWLPDVDTIEELCSSIKRWSDGPWWVNPYAHEEWFGTNDMPQALQFLKYGWDKAIDSVDIDDAALKMNRDILDEFARTRNTEGSQVDVGAFLAGEPENMYNYQPNITRKKTVKLIVNFSADCGGGKHKLETRGTTLTAIIDWLEKSGYRVRLDVCDCYCGYGVSRNEGWCIAFCAKDFDQPLDIGRVSFMIGSSSMLGRILFGIESTSYVSGTVFGWGYGGVAPVPDAIRQEYDYVIDYGMPFNKDVAAKIIEQIVTGHQPKEPPLIDTEGMPWHDFERYTQYEIPEIPIIRLRSLPQDLQDAIGDKLSDLPEGTTTSDVLNIIQQSMDQLEVEKFLQSQQNSQNSQDDNRLFVPAKPSKWYKPYKYLIRRKDGNI